jgi:hypothetical protein
MTLLNVFYSRINSCRYVFEDGSEAAFIGGRYTTDDPVKIAHLENEIKLGHPHIFVDPSMRQMDSDDLDPMEVIKKKIIAEAIAAGEIQRITQSSQYAQQALIPSSSSNLVDVKTAEEAALGLDAGDQNKLKQETGAKALDLKHLIKK